MAAKRYGATIHLLSVVDAREDHTVGDESQHAAHEVLVGYADERPTPFEDVLIPTDGSDAANAAVDPRDNRQTDREQRWIATVSLFLTTY
ncbi:Nucleotide-binding protein, UspA family (plasmid) [Halomicrobium sp. LC1Hm]|nr:Nucleotide-binding protein, UspA family [Halomicrobium sp. LC1Hm]